MLEVLLATSLLLIFSVGAISVALSMLENVRLGEEEATATRFSSQGLEILRSIRNRSFDELTITSGSGSGSDTVDGIWTLAGDSDHFGKYERTLSVSEVYRDGDGEIVWDGGTLDLDTLRTTSVVEWDFTPGRHEQMELSTYLTRFGDPL